MSDKEKAALIFLPGFSTAEKVTDVSGRGVGMDVVKTNLDQLGGKVEIDSEPGRGTIFRIKLPLTLAIIPSLIVDRGTSASPSPRSTWRSSPHPRPTRSRSASRWWATPRCSSCAGA